MSKKIVEDVISATSKGTFTLPVKMRRLWGLNEKGAKLTIRFYPERGEAVISKPVEFTEIQAMTSKYIKVNKEPLTEVSAFYQERRGK